MEDFQKEEKEVASKVEKICLVENWRMKTELHLICWFNWEALLQETDSLRVTCSFKKIESLFQLIFRKQAVLF